MKLPSQTISFNIPTSSQLRCESIKHGFISEAFLTTHFPPQLLPLAYQIVELQQKIQFFCDEFDLIWLRSKQEQLELNRAETLRLKSLERNKRREKEEQKIRRGKIKSLNPLERRLVRLTGKLPEEHKAEMLKWFEEYKETLKET